MRVGWFLGACMAMGAQEGKVAEPRSFEAIASGPTAIRLYWLPAEGATGYRVQRDGQVIGTLPADAREMQDSGLSPGATYRYSIAALHGETASPPRAYVERTFAEFPAATVTYDIVVAQASSGGVAAAIEAARRGRRVALIEPTTRLGGMPVNGLSATDLRRAPRASGFLVRFRDRVRDLYAAEGVKADGLKYEPRIAHQAMKSLLYEVPSLTVYRRARLASVRARKQRRNKRVEAVTVEELGADGQPTGRRAEFRAQVFIDATDSGDLAAWAGAPYRVGREARTDYEPHNGVIYYDRANDRRLPGSTGAADRRIQSYAYLVTVRDYGPAADKTIPKPPGYHRENYIHTPAWAKSWAVTSGKLPENKYELNQHPQGGDLQEINYAYPEGDYRERERVERLYRDHVLGYLYYIQTEQGQKQLGLPEDEYRDTGGFPPLLYVREGRRILGEQLPVESDIANARRILRPESVGIGDYPMDSHAVRVKTDWSSPDMGEGEWWLYQYTPWYSVPFDVMIPQKLDNVFVTTAVSSTHVSFGTFRMEPVRMAFGQAAGIAADLCLRFDLTNREVPVRQVQEDLLPHAANPRGDPNIFLTFLTDAPFGSRHYAAIQYLAARGFAFGAETFQPDAPTTRRQLYDWLTRLAARARHPGGRYAPAPQPVHTATLDALRDATPDSAPVTRIEATRRLVSLLPGLFPPVTGSPASPYVDITDAAALDAAERLRAYGVDSRLWDGPDAFAPEGKLRFQPEKPMTHAELAALVSVVQRGIGPLFFDHALDLANRTLKRRSYLPMPRPPVN